MRALIRDLEGVVLADVPSPTPGAGEVVVDVAYAGVCRTDLAVAAGVIAVAPRRVIGHELAGYLDGTPVTVIPFDAHGRWLGIDRDGAFAERVCVPAAQVIALPRTLPLVLGAYVEPVAAAMGALASIRAGDRVSIAGDGRIAELTARVVTAHGAHVVATRGSRADESFDVVIETAGDVASRLSRLRHGSFHAAIDWLHTRRIVVDDLLAEPQPLSAFDHVLAAARTSEARKQMFAIDGEHG